MRALFFWVYLLIVGGFVAAVYLMEYLGSDLYLDEFSGSYQEYVARITPLIVDELDSAEYPQKVLTHWRTIVGEELVSLEIIPQTTELMQTSEPVVVTYLEVTDLADEIRLVSKLPETYRPDVALEFYFIDAWSDDYESWYHKGIIAVYLFMTVIIGLLVLVLFRFMQRIIRLTNSVITGDLSARISSTSVAAFNTLSENLNHMVQELESKHLESEIFLGAIYHELRSPVTKLRLALDIALNSKDVSLLQELLQDMDVDLEELNKLMEDILMLSRLRLQKDAPEMTDTDLVDVISGIVSQQNDAKILFTAVNSVVVKSNEVLLERCLINIVSNAVKFAKHQVNIEIRRSATHAEIIIADDGPGIPASEREHVFQPFYRMDKSRGRESGGVGLGLAIAKLAVNTVSGEIAVNSSISGGAQFVVQLPLN